MLVMVFRLDLEVSEVNAEMQKIGNNSGGECWYYHKVINHLKTLSSINLCHVFLRPRLATLRHRTTIVVIICHEIQLLFLAAKHDK